MVSYKGVVFFIADLVNSEYRYLTKLTSFIKTISTFVEAQLFTARFRRVMDLSIGTDLAENSQLNYAHAITHDRDRSHCKCWVIVLLRILTCHDRIKLRMLIQPRFSRFIYS